MYELCLLGLVVPPLSSFTLLLFLSMFETWFSSFVLILFEFGFHWINALYFSKAFLVRSIFFFQMSFKRLKSHSFSHLEKTSLLKISGMIFLSKNCLICQWYQYWFESVSVYCIVFPFPFLIFLVLVCCKCSFLNHSLYILCLFGIFWAVGFSSK